MVPDVQRTIAETQKAYSKWGTVRGSGVWRGEDGVAEAIERAANCLKSGDHVMVYSGARFENIPDWRNLGAMVDWFLPRGATLVSGNDPTRFGVNVVLSDESIGRPPLPDDWQCLYDEWAAKVYRFMPGSGADNEKYAGYSQDVPLPISPAWPPYVQVARRLSLIVAACAVWMMAGWLMLRNLEAEWLQGVARGVVALITGALTCSVLVLGWSWLGLPVGWQPLGISALLLGGGWWMSHALRARYHAPSLGRRDYVWQTVLAVSWLIFGVFGAWVTLSSDANGAPDLGYYGIKAKAFYLEGGVPGDFPGGERWRLHAPSYPLGGAMMLEWLFAWMGDADIHLGRVTQGLWLGAAGVLVAAWLRGRGLPKMLAWGVGFLPLGTSGSLFYLTEFYQEALLNVALLSGLFLIVDSVENDPFEKSDHGSSRGNEALMLSGAGQKSLKIEPPHVGCYGHAWAGALLLGACAWIKSDGLLIWLMVSALWIFLARRGSRQIALKASLAGALLWIVPWRLWMAGAGVGLGDYSVTVFSGRRIAENAEVLSTVGRRLLVLMHLHGGTYAWFWWVVLAALILRGAVCWRQRDVRLMLLAGLTFLATFCGTYLFSTVPLDWHMNSLYRLLAMLQPWMLAAGVASLTINYPAASPPLRE